MPDKKLVVPDGPELAMMADLIGNCIGTIYIPRDEDFGMSPVESMATGKPVIGVTEGGLLESVVDGETGFLIPGDPTVDDIIHAVAHLTRKSLGDAKKV